MNWRGRSVTSAKPDNAILDGEIVCLDPKGGRSIFEDLMFRRTEPYFYAFDVLTEEGQALRDRPLIERQHCLKAIMPDIPARFCTWTILKSRARRYIGSVVRTI